ncbi:MAG: HalOD1 output domain-containing protein [Haloarculaceae archaeon]
MDEGALSYAIVTQVAEAKGIEPEELRPLHDVVDPDALESLFDDANGSALRDGFVSFAYEGFVVTVDDEQSIDVATRDASN